MQRDAGLLVRRGRAVSAGAFLALVVSLVTASPVAAHTELDYTLPADQEEVTEPVVQITVAFSDPVTLVGAGFEVFTPQEVIVEPGVFTEDNAVFILQLDAPLAGGAAGVRYEVVAADGHVLEGGFSFTVPSAVPTTPATTAAPTTPAAPVATTAPAPSTGTTPSTSTQVVIATAPPVTSGDIGTSDAETVADTLADGDDGNGGATTGLVIGVVAAIAAGAIAFVVLRSRASTPT